MTEAVEVKAKTILRAELGSDGVMKFRLAKRHADKLHDAYQACGPLLLVPALEAKAKAAADALEALIAEVTD